MIVIYPNVESGNLVPPSYERCIQEVMLRKTISRIEYEERLASFVLTRWRLPRTRAIWNMNLLLAVQATVTANAIVEEAGCFVKFTICAGGEIDTRKLYSLRFEDALPHHCITLKCRGLLKDGDDAEGSSGTTLLDVSVDEFEARAESLKLAYSKLRSVISSLAHSQKKKSTHAR